MAKKHRRTKNPDISLGWILGGLAVVGYGIYWWQDRQRNLATDARYAAQAAIDERTRLYDAGLLGGQTLERPEGHISASQMKEHLARYEQGRAPTL